MAKKYSWYEEYESSGNRESTWSQMRGDLSSTATSNVTNRVNTWLQNHSKYVANYESRNKDRKYNYEDAYVKDSASWLETVSKQKSNFDAEADSILAYIDRFKGYLDDDFVKSVQTTLTGARGQQDAILDNSSKDNEWWSSFKDEEEYKTAVRYDGYSKKYSGQKYDDIQQALGVLEKGEEKDWLSYYQYDLYQKDSNYASKSLSGLKSFEAQKVAEQEKEANKTWWDRTAEMLAYSSSDTSLPASQLAAAAHAYRTDTTYREPSDKWSEGEKRQFGYLYAEDPNKAYEYAEQVNNYYNAAAKYQQQQDIGDAASKNFGTGTLGTMGAIATSPLAMADLLDNVAEYVGRGTITQKSMLTPYEYGQAAQSGIANKLNEKYGTINENAFAIGGKGLGDIYSLGVSTANSLVSAYTMGGTGTLINFIGQGGASGVDDALSRGATPEQALLYGSIVGSLEGLTEAIPAGDLIKVGSSATLKNLLKQTAKQGFEEMVEEGTSSFFSNIADNFIMKDKSNFNIMVKELMAEGMSQEDAEEAAWKRMVGDIAFDAMGGFASGSAHALTVGGTKTVLNPTKGNKKNIEAIKQYGKHTNELIQEGLQSDPKSESYQLAQKYQKQVEGKDGKDGKAMTGFQIRNLVAANEKQFAVEDFNEARTQAKDRLKELGENNTQIWPIAELVAKRATGQELTRAEKSALARSQFGAQVAKEMTTPAQQTESGSNGYNITYKSMTDRVGEEGRYGVAESGQTTLRNEGTATKIAEVTQIEDGQMTVKLEDGREVYAGDIDFANESESFLYSAIADMENITPAAATALVKNFDATSKQTTQEYVNGIDEAYTYGYHGYSVQDLKAGNFTSNLSSEQMMSAYRLGQSARAISNENYDAPKVQMRTAMQAAISKKQATQQMKTQFASDDVEVYFEDGGNVVKFDEHSHQYDDKRMAGVNAAKFMSKMGIGSKYYFYESYENADGVRVYKDSNGNEVTAPNGIFKASDGSIHIDINAGNNGEGTTLFTMGHELTHFVKANSAKQFQGLAELVKEAYDKTDMTMHERVVAKQNQLSEIRGEHVTYDEAFEEVVADAMSTMLTDGNLYEKLAQLKTKDKGIFNTIKKFFDKMIAKFKDLYASLTPDQKDAQDIRELKDMFDRIQDAFAKALVEASDNFQASETVLAQAGISVDANTDAGSIYSVRDVLSEADRNKVAKTLAERFGVTEKEAKEWLKAETSLASLILNPKYSMYLDYEGDPNEVAIKQNSDYPQGTVDFSNICKKRREFTQVMNRILRNFPNHVFAATDLAKIRTIMGEEGMTLPCGICYVEDRRQLDTIVAQDFINGLKLYREGSKTRPDGKPFNANQLKGLQLTDGDDYVPSIYELVSLEGRNSLKAKNPNMEAAWVRYNNARGMQAVRLLTNEAEYQRQILKYNKKTVQSKNDHGGLRIYSFSDAEMFHLIDIIQVITDSAAVGLSLQGYTKVNEYAKAVKDTGEKLNRSLIPKGDLGYHMENGKVVLDYDTVEGIDIYHKDFFDNKDNPNVGNITIGINDVQIRASMLSDFVDQIIPFHTGQSEEVLGEKGIAAWDNYKDYQTEKDLATGRTSSHQVNIYTEVFQAAEAEGKPIQNKRQFVEKFLQVCKENGLQPRFAQFLNTDANGDYIYTEGYHKFLVDFKTFAQTEVGEYLPQMPVKPIFDNAYITGLLEAYVEEQQAKDAEVAKQMPKVIERITKEIVKPGIENKDTNRYSSRYEKRFFPGNVFPTGQTHTAIAEWANRKDVKVGDKRLVLYRGAYYRVQKFDDMDFGYLITKKYDAHDYEEELREYGEIDVEESVQGGIDEILARSGETAEHGQRGYHADSSGSEYGSEDNRLREMDEEEHGRRENSGETERDRERSLRDQRQTGRNERLEWTPQELYDKMLDLDRKLVFAEGAYATRLRNQRERYAKMIDKMNGWDKVRYSERTNAPVFYSQMGKVVDGMKQDKFGASSVISMLRGRGVKAEEIRWSGIQAFLDGKKSVTKAELLDFIKGSMLHIEEEENAGGAQITLEPAYVTWDGESNDIRVMRGGEEFDTLEWDEDNNEFTSSELGYVFSDADEALEYYTSKYGGGGTRWGDYKLDGGENYRELVFKMPGSDYSNQAMEAHWGRDNRGVLAHARMQDFEVDGKKMLFVEEIQSDWHNAGQKQGYFSESDKVTVNNTEVRHENGWYNLYRDGKGLHQGVSEQFLKQRFRNGITEDEIHEGLVDEYNRSVEHSGKGWKAPDAPFKSNYHEYVLKRLIRMAAEEGYDSIGWTTADIQSDRWSDDYAEGYRIEYDQDIPKFLKKYGKQWGAEVGKIEINTRGVSEWEREMVEKGMIELVPDMTKVWSMDITPTMKNSVLTEGQAMYSERTNDSVSNRSLLANAFEGISQNSVEYKMIQDYKGHIKQLNKLENELSDLNAEIRKIRFGTEGARDAQRLRQLEDKAKRIAKDINRYDKRLLNMEASEPLRKVIDREKVKASQKTKEHVKEIQQNKKLRAEQTELRHKIRKAVRDLDKILNRGNKKLNVKENMQAVVSKALKAADILFTDNYGNYDMLRNGIGADLSDSEEALVNTCTQMLKDIDRMPTDGYESWQARQEAENRLSIKMSKLKEVFARERKRLNNTTVSSILGELADAYASLEKSEQSYVQGAYTEAVHNFLKSLQSEVGGTIVKDMTKSQLESVYAAYQMVLNTVRNANKMFNEALKQSREQLGNAVIQEVVTAGGTHGLWTKGEIARSQASWNNMKPVWVANRIGSDTFGKLMDGLFKGQYNFAVDVDEAKQFKLSMDEKYHPRNWDAKKLYGFESSTGRKFELNLQQIMSLYAFSKREQAYSHILNGGFVFEANSTVLVDKKGIKRTYLHDGATSYKLNEVTLNEIISSLTADQKAYVDEMQKYLSDVMGAKGNEVSMKLYGIKMFKEQFYFPLRSSGAYMEKAKEAEMKKQQGQINLVNSGFTHAVKPEAKNPIILAGFLDVWAEHCNEMSMYHSMVLPMEDFRKVYNYSTIHDEKMDSASVYQTIQDAYGKAATGYIDQLYRELNAGATVDPRETAFKARISKFKKAAVMLSASVVVQQFSSIGRAYAVIDPKYFVGAKVKSDTKMSVADEMKKYAPVAIIKEMGGFDTGTKGSAKNYIMAEEYHKTERIKGLMTDEQYRGDVMGYFPAKADELTWCNIWEAAKRETKAKHSGMDVTSEEFLKLAGERFSEIIEKTQVYDSVLARSANMRSKGGLMSMATAFMAEPTTTINLLEDALRGRSVKSIARAFGAVAASIILNNALASIVYAMRDDDDDETFIEKYFESFASGMVDDINPMTYYPFLKDVYSLFQGYDVERADMSVIADLRDAIKKAMSVIGKDTSDMDEDELADHHKQVNSVLMSLLDAGCSALGVPLKNVRRDVSGVINAYQTINKDLTERDTSWNSFWDKVGSAVKDTIPIYAWTRDKPKADKLYEAIMSGDKTYLGRIKSTYKTDDAYTSAVRKVLRENDPRIREAAEAKYETNSTEYKRIFREIQKEGKFSFDDIMSAINSEVSSIKKKLEPASETSEYSATDFVNAVVLGEVRNAETMRDEIIATNVANGDTREEAEESFASSVSTSTRKAFDSNLLDEAGAKKMLLEYADMDEEKATAKASYWAFIKAHPKYREVLSQDHVEKYHEFAEPEDISLDVFVQYVTGTKGLETIRDKWGDEVRSKREQVLEVIDSLPLTWQQKDALYLAAGYAESKILDVPW